MEESRMQMETKYSKRPPEWVEANIEEIEKTNPDSEKYVSIRYSLNVDAITKYEDWVKSLNVETFQEQLMALIDHAGMTNQKFYTKAHIDRKLFSAINNNREYHPSKSTAVACCLALDLNLFKSGTLLEAAGYKLSINIPWDRVIIYCLRNAIFDIDDVNELLYAYGEKCIGE